MLDTMNAASHSLVRVNNNIMAIHALHDDLPKPELLNQYSGWGGLRNALYDKQVFRQLKQMLNSDEIKSLKSTVSNAYFTPPVLIDFIYDVIQLLLPKNPCHVLEPSAGQGRFLQQLPEEWKSAGKITAVEIDEISCQFLRKLYSTINVYHGGFETFQPEHGFDVIVGNPPFGQLTLQDKQHPDLAALSIHHYFVAKCMRLLNQGGILGMVLPRYVMDNKDKHPRDIIAEEGGHLLAAFRLPNDMFDDAKVTVDVVFFQKQASPEPNLLWRKSQMIIRNYKKAYLNPYFAVNPDHILGKLVFAESYGRQEIHCQRDNSNPDVFNTLYALVKKKLLAADEAARDDLQTRLSLLIDKQSKIQHEINRIQSLLN